MIHKNHPKYFFTQEELEQISDAIAQIESKTTGRIEIFMEWRCPLTDLLSRGVKLFQEMALDRHPTQNAVLIYFATGFQIFSIVCGKEFSQKVNDLFWIALKTEAERYMDENANGGGTLKIIEIIEDVLLQYFSDPNKIQRLFTNPK